MSNASEQDMISLKRIARFIRTLPRIVAQYPWGPLPSDFEVFTDSDYAGCPLTRRSTVGGAITWGGKFIKGWSKTLEVLALSSGEAELGGLIKAGAEGLGMQAVMRDFGLTVGIKILSDATAAIGMVRRLGLGKVRHLATADLWIQQRVRKGEISIENTREN